MSSNSTVQLARLSDTSLSGAEYIRQQRHPGAAPRDGSPLQDVEPQHPRLLSTGASQDDDREQEIQDHGCCWIP